jgi:phosphoglycerate dehydrogenase-like enzyme
MRVKVFGLPSGLTTRLAGSWPEAEIVTSADDRRDCVAALVWDVADEDLLRFVAENEPLRWVHTRASGASAAVQTALHHRGIVLTNGAGSHGAAVAEHVLALLLAHYKQLKAAITAQATQRWSVPAGLDELRGKTVGILGLGDLGRSIARLLIPFGTTVLGLRRSGLPVDEVSATYRPDQLGEFLPRLDVLVIAVPLTQRTSGLIGAEQLALLRPGAVLVNVGRGKVVAHDALLAVLASGHLGAALLDVFAIEPLPRDSPLWSAPNVLVTAHCADSTEQTEQRCLDLMLANVARFRACLPVQNVLEYVFS